MSNEDNDKLEKKFTELEPKNVPNERFKKVSKPEQDVGFQEWSRVIQKNFPELEFPAEVGLSIISQILIKDVTNPFALTLVDVPASGKTITANFFADIEGLTYATDKFTPASFISNAVNVKPEKLAEIDLLPRIRYKMFLIRDLATLFSKRDDDLNESLGILTRVLDGEGLSADSGVHGQRKYVGEYLFMLLACSTPIPPRVWKMMGNLGSRMFYLRINSKEKSEEELTQQITNTSHKLKELECRKATREFLHTLWNRYPNGIEWNREADEKNIKLVVSRCAMLLARLRGVINVWKVQDDSDYQFTRPIIEKPDRINQLLYNICRGHALVRGRTQINALDLKVVVELAIDSAMITRSELFRHLLDTSTRYSVSTDNVMSVLKCSRPTALKEMETLKILGICDLDEVDVSDNPNYEKNITVIKLNDKFKWFRSDECRKIRDLSVNDMGI